MILRPIKTAAGRQASINAKANGYDLTLTHMSLGDKAGTLDPALTALRNERERVPCFGKRISLDLMHLDSLFDGPAEFWPREVGLWAGTVLVYYWSSDGKELGYKNPNADWLIGIDLTLDPNSDGPINITAAAPNWTLTVMPQITTILMSLNDTNRLVLTQRFALDNLTKAVQELSKPVEDPHTQYWNAQRGNQAIAAAAAQWGVDGPTLRLEVGPGKPFADIQAAYESLNGKSLKTSVLIKVSDGTYNTTGILLQNHPNADKIRIEGNPANPAACVINFVADANKQSHGMVIRRARGVQLAGFRFVGSCTATNFTHRCLRLDTGAQAWIEPGTVLVEGGYQGVQMDDMSMLSAERLTIKGCADWHLVAASGSHVTVNGIRIDGVNKDAVTQVPAHINPDMPKATPSGILSQDGARLWAAESDVRRVWHGFWSQNAAYLWCDCSVVDDVYYGMIARTSGVLWSHWWDVTPARAVPKRTVITNAKTIAFNSGQGGRMYVPGARAESCANGFYADSHGFIQAGSSWTVNCTRAYNAESMALIEAYDTRAKSSNCTTLYSPSSHATFGNDNGMVRFS